MRAYFIHRIAWSGLSLALFAGCGSQPRHEAPSSAEIPVRIVTPDAGERGTLTIPARIKAAEEATLTARAPGRVSGFPAREGQAIAEGALLVRFDAPEARRAVEAARADEQAARVAAANATRQYARIESLFTSGVVAQSDREVAEAADRGAAARLAQATAAREIAESAFEVRAPFAGVLVRRHVDVGADVQAGQALVDLRSPSGSEVVAAVPEAAAAGLASARAWVQVRDGAWRPARVLRADGMVDPTTRTRTARFAPLERAALEPGAFARVRLSYTGGGPEAPGGVPLALPFASIVRRGALTGVYVIEDGRAWLRWLRLGHTQDDRVEVLSGLVGDEQVAASPLGLADGARVRVER